MTKNRKPLTVSLGCALSTQAALEKAKHTCTFGVVARASMLNPRNPRNPR
ncbi:hypothetical protein [Paraburkholderia sp. J76]|nr:hypothetical protein [Paraburkholderia sp. J76]